jgi:hypothetical protein
VYSKRKGYAMNVPPKITIIASAIGGLFVLGVVVGVVLLANTGNSPSSKATVQPPSSNSTSDDTSNQPPTSIRIPEDYTVYVDKDYKFSVAYPKVWGDLSAVSKSDRSDPTADPAATVVKHTVAVTNSPLGSSLLNGSVTASVYPANTFQLTIRSDGAAVAPAKLGTTYGWKVVKPSGTAPVLAIGDNYSVKSSVYQAQAPIYNFSEADAKHARGRWAFTSGNNFIVVELPTLSAPNAGQLSEADLKAYTAVGTNMAKTMRPTN